MFSRLQPVAESRSSNPSPRVQAQEEYRALFFSVGAPLARRKLELAKQGAFRIPPEDAGRRTSIPMALIGRVLDSHVLVPHYLKTKFGATSMVIFRLSDLEDPELVSTLGFLADVRGDLTSNGVLFSPVR